MLLNHFTYHDPKTAQEAAKLLHKHPNAKILAGGTFLLNRLKSLKRKGLKTPDHIISLKKIKELYGIHILKDHVKINAMTTMHDLICNEELIKGFPVLKTIANEIGATQIRNMATIGGNITGRYTWTEFPSCLIALDANLCFIGPDGNEEILSAEEFLNNNAKTDKILKTISIPKTKNTFTIYSRVAKSIDLDLPMLTICIKSSVSKNKFSDVHFVVNNGIAFSRRDLKLETFLNSKTCTLGIEQEALQNIDESLYDLVSNEYKKDMFELSIKQSIREIIKQINDKT